MYLLLLIGGLTAAALLLTNGPPEGRWGRLVGVAILGAVVGGFLGAGAGLLELVVYPRESFPSSSEGLAQGLFLIMVLFAYTGVGAVLGAIGALSADRRRRVGLALGAATGLAGGLVLVVAFPAVDRLWTTQGSHDLFDGGMITLAALGCVILGAMLGWLAGARERTPDRTAPRP